MERPHPSGWGLFAFVGKTTASLSEDAKSKTRGGHNEDLPHEWECQEMKLKRDTWILLGVLTLTAGYIWFRADEAERLSQATQAEPATYVPAVPAERKDWEARKRMEPTLERLANDPRFTHPTNVSQTSEAPAVPLTDAEKKEIYERHYANELKRGPSPISEPPQEK